VRVHVSSLTFIGASFRIQLKFLVGRVRRPHTRRSDAVDHIKLFIGQLLFTRETNFFVSLAVFYHHVESPILEGTKR
jgi:hypothetical protein